MTQPAEEPPGYSTSMGFVKSNPLNNDYYVDQWQNDPWYWPIKRAHLEIERLAPGYNVSQIKEKFGELRFYYSLPEGAAPVIREKCEDWVRWAEAVTLGITQGLKMAKGEFHVDEMYYPAPRETA